jgi:hypothetical protein
MACAKALVLIADDSANTDDAASKLDLFITISPLLPA